MKSPQLKSKILAEYLEKKISLTKLGMKYGVDRNTITAWLRQKGLSNKYHVQENLDKKEVIRLYVKERKSAEEIALLVNVASTSPIHCILDKAGVKRTQQETMMGKWVKEKNPNWKGGTTTYEKWRRKTERFSARMTVFKLMVKLRDKFACRLCGSTTKIETNHIIPVRKITKEKDLFDPNNGITLCRKCHLSIHFKETEYEDIFRQLIKEPPKFRGTPTADGKTARAILTQAD